MGQWQRLYKKLPIVRELLEIRDLLRVLTDRSLDEYANRTLVEQSHRADPKRLAQYERQVFSQNGEDGILAEIFRRIGAGPGYFVEIGAGNGRENNTAFLLVQNWQGLWIDAHPSLKKNALREHASVLQAGRLQIAERFLNAENIAAIFQEFNVPVELDLLSIDIDRNTYFIWEALAAYRPKVVIVEYNAMIPPHVDWKVDYVGDRCWNGTSYFGASLKAYELLGKKLGYSLVGCDLTGVNAFLVRSDLVHDRFCEPFVAENHHEPPRYWLSRRNGHPRSFGDQKQTA